MPNARFYWDSDVFLSFINGDQARLPDIRGLLESATRREVEVVTSVFTITEVAFAATEKQAGAADSSIEARIDKLWAPASPVGLVDFHSGIAVRARDLMRHGVNQGWSLKPGDAIHLATAQGVGVSELHTYNLADFAKWATHIGCTVKNPQAAQQTLPTGDT